MNAPADGTGGGGSGNGGAKKRPADSLLAGSSSAAASSSSSASNVSASPASGSSAPASGSGSSCRAVSYRNSIGARAQRRPLVVGCLMGSFAGRVLEVVNSFELVYDRVGAKEKGAPVTSSEEEPELKLRLDEGVLQKKLVQYKQVFSTLDVVGCYMTAALPVGDDGKPAAEDPAGDGGALPFAMERWREDLLQQIRTRLMEASGSGSKPSEPNKQAAGPSSRSRPSQRFSGASGSAAGGVKPASVQEAAAAMGGAGAADVFSNVLLVIDPCPNHLRKDLPVHLYDTEDLPSSTGGVRVSLNELPFSLESSDAERVGIDHLGKSLGGAVAAVSAKQAAAGQLASHLAHLGGAAASLSERLRTVAAFLSRVQAERDSAADEQGDASMVVEGAGRAAQRRRFPHAVARRVQGLVRGRARLGAGDMAEAFLTEHGDALLSIYLAELTLGLAAVRDLEGATQAAFSGTAFPGVPMREPGAAFFGDDEVPEPRGVGAPPRPSAERQRGSEAQVYAAIPFGSGRSIE